jgi:hypothetical protein
MTAICDQESQSLITHCLQCDTVTESDSCPDCKAVFDAHNSVYLQPCGECHDVDDHECMHMAYRLYGSIR